MSPHGVRLFPCKVDDLPIDSVGEGVVDRYFSYFASKRQNVVRISWQPQRVSGPYFIEATRDESGKEWFVVAVRPPKSPPSPGESLSEPLSALIVYELWDDGAGPRGPIKFRVVPTEPTPPKE